MALVFNAERVYVEIEGIKVKEDMKYLGITLNTGSSSFKLHKENKIKACRRFSNLTYSVVQKSCNNVLVGKAYWKSIVLPSMIYLVWKFGCDLE